MDRRGFLKCGPMAVASLLVSRSADDELAPQRQRVHGLLEVAERAYAEAHELIHWPWRYHEARPLLEAATEAAAEAWLRDRGVEAKPRAHYSWLFVACDRPDEISGLAWREVHTALLRVQSDCDSLGRMANHKDFVGSVRITLQARARATLLKGLDTVALCLEGVRSEVVHRMRFRALKSAV